MDKPITFALAFAPKHERCKKVLWKIDTGEEDRSGFSHGLHSEVDGIEARLVRNKLFKTRDYTM